MCRLHLKLREYYSQEGSQDAVRIRAAGPYRLAFDIILPPRTSLDHDPARVVCLLVLPLYASPAAGNQAEMFYRELLTRISRSPSFELIAQTTARGYARQLGDARYFAAQTGADSVLEGTPHIWFAATGKPRPVDFETRPGQGHTYAAWIRTGE